MTKDSGQIQSVQIDRDTLYLFPESACAFHIFEDYPNNILLIEQWRPMHERYTLELPGGRVEEGEKPEGTALRELTEETGIVGDSATYLLKLDLDFSASKHATHIVMTRSATSLGLSSSCRLIDFQEAWNAVISGAITHAPTVAVILLMMAKGGRVEGFSE